MPMLTLYLSAHCAARAPRSSAAARIGALVLARLARDMAQDLDAAAIAHAARMLRAQPARRDLPGLILDARRAVAAALMFGMGEAAAHV
ncbi:hypothetical protein [Falsiroseomonas sp. CW058]|uniref:hypothetical protein n=1 Tax=Falsiroseomonas sp. CW058 TaxID=3388664 RepID=UPI003D31E6DE